MSKSSLKPLDDKHIDDIIDVSKEEVYALSKIKSSEWVVYIMRSVPRPMRTYAGVTNHILRRIRQHNGEIAGGAYATKTTRPWELYALIYGFGTDKSRALRCEWFTKVGNYRASFGMPESNGIIRRRFLVKHAMSKCREGPQLHARMTVLEPVSNLPIEPRLERLPAPVLEKMVVVLSENDRFVPPHSTLSVVPPESKDDCNEVIPEKEMSECTPTDSITPVYSDKPSENETKPSECI